MSKIRTIVELNSYLNKELSWRKQELINLKLLHEQARDHHAILLRRAGVALLYAHWEGFVKNAGTAYVEFVGRQGQRYRNLRPNFIALGMKGVILQARETVRGRMLTEVADFFLGRLEERATLHWKGAIQTGSNLSSERLQDIIAILGLDYKPFELREKLVLDRLLEMRNCIAHGNYLDVDGREFSYLHNDVIAMLDELRDQIENAAQTGAFRRQT